MSIDIPNVTATAPATPIGKNAQDYEKFVVVDTTGSLVDAGQVAYGIDLVKDDTLQNRANFLEELFGLVGMEFKVREARANKIAKVASPMDLIKALNKGK